MSDTRVSTDRRAPSGAPPGRGVLLKLAAAWQHNFPALLQAAWQVRQQNFGRAVRLCSIVPGRLGGCSEDCRWCAQSAQHDTDCHATTAGTQDVQRVAKQAIRWGAGNVGIVNSGRRPTEKQFSAVLAAAPSIEPAGCCASLGELTGDQAARLAAAGFTRYNHNLETSRRMFPQMVTTHTYDDRLGTLEVARKAGLSLCCGGIFGLGETWADRIDLAMTLRDTVKPDSVPLNFLHRIPGTPLADVTPLRPDECLAIIALYRLAMPTVDLKVAGGREANIGGLQNWIFYAGATSILIGNYLTTSGRCGEDDLAMIDDLALEVVPEFHRPSETQGHECSMPYQSI